MDVEYTCTHDWLLVKEISKWDEHLKEWVDLIRAMPLHLRLEGERRLMTHGRLYQCAKCDKIKEVFGE